MLATIVETANLLISLTFAGWISSPEFRGGGRKDVLLSASSHESGTGKTPSQLCALIDRRLANQVQRQCQRSVFECHAIKYMW